MNNFIKSVLNKICGLLTLLIDAGQKIMCNRESYKMYKIPNYSNPKEIEEEYIKNKNLLRKYGFRGVKRDFLVFRNYLVDKGNDPTYIVPSVIVHRYLSSVFNPIPYNAYFSDKNMLDKILPKEYLPETILRRIDGIWMDENYNPISLQDIKGILDQQNSLSSFIVKPAKDSSSGRGILLFSKNNEKWLSSSDNEDFFTFISKENNYDLIIQKKIEQNEFLQNFCSTAVCTFRIVAYNSPVDNEIHHIWTGLRIGAQGSIVDNNHAGGIIVGIDKTGKLNSYGTDQYGNKYTNFNNIDFNSGEIEVPDYENLITLAKTLTPMLLPNRWICFDITIDKSGHPVVVECNFRGYSGWLCQFAGDYMFGDKTEEILKFLNDNKTKVNKFYYSIN